MNTAPEHEVFKALADPTRLRIVCLLLDGELCVCDLTEVLQIPQPTVSRHMATLKQHGLAADRRAGKWVHYTLVDNSPINELLAYLRSLRHQQPYSLDFDRLSQHRKARSC